MSDLRVLFVGSLRPFLTTRARFDAMREMGVRVEPVDPDEHWKSRNRLMTRLNFWTLRTPAVYAFNRSLLAAARSFRPNVAWIEKGTFVFPATLTRLRRIAPMKLVYHNTDDTRVKSMATRVHWRYLMRTLDRYDVHVTSNLHNVREFRERGFPNVHHMELAANPAIEDPGEIPADERKELGAPVGFVGHWEPFTESLLAPLSEAGLPLKIYGGGWERAGGPPSLAAAVQHRFVWGQDYARAIRSFDVNLGIVSRINRNHTASRTFQIPALGSFLLHQRNELVTGYFREDEEAAFFDSAEELIEKCRYYLDHPDERRRIAEAGRRRCVESGYFETDRVREVVELLRREIASL